MPEPPPAIKALRSLIKRGARNTPELESSMLIELPFVKDSGSPAQRAQAFADVLEEVVDKGLKGIDREVGLALFALGAEAGADWRVRYDQLVQLRGRHNWELYRKEPLLRDLEMVWLALQRVGNDHAASSAETSAVVTNDARRTHLLDNGDFKTNFYRATQNFPAGPGQPVEIYVERKITATRDGLTSWRQHHRVSGHKAGDKHPDLALLGPGTLRVIYDKPNSGLPEAGRVYVSEVEFPRPLKRDESFCFTVRRLEVGDFAEMTAPGCRDTFGLLGVTAPIERATVAVKFPDGLRPPHVWAFANRPHWMQPRDADETDPRELDATGYVSESWTNLLPSYSYGLSWEW